MTQRDDSVFLRHILEATEKIAAYIAGLQEEEFFRTSMAHDAVIRQLEIIGEATKNLSRDFRQAHPDVPWRDIAGTRDKLIHGYMGVDLKAVWATASDDVPSLGSYIQRVLQALGG
jgi:uncharacterized protein with HEPN domain